MLSCYGASHPSGRRKMSHVSLDQGGDGQLTPGLRLLAGAMAGIVGMSATYPMDMVRTARATHAARAARAVCIGGLVCSAGLEGHVRHGEGMCCSSPGYGRKGLGAVGWQGALLAGLDLHRGWQGAGICGS